MASYDIEGTENAARDRDETRRLLYMARLAPFTEKYNLAGTLVNALVHHSGDGAFTADEAAQYILRVLNNEDADDKGKAWLNAQIARITAQLDGPPAEFRAQ